MIKREPVVTGKDFDIVVVTDLDGTVKTSMAYPAAQCFFILDGDFSQQYKNVKSFAEAFAIFIDNRKHWSFSSDTPYSILCDLVFYKKEADKYEYENQ